MQVRWNMRNIDFERESILSNTVLKSLDVLECLADSGQPLTASEIARVCGMSRPTVYRLLATLQSRGYVSNIEHEYTLGSKILSLSGVILNSIDLAYPAYPYLQQLSDLSGETACASVLDGNEVLSINKVESKQPMRLNSPIGARNPLYCTSMGKSMLAYLPEYERDALLHKITLHPFTDYTITDKEDLIETLGVIKERGYAYDDLEMEDNVRSVAAPVFNHMGYPIGAISLAGPAYRLSIEKLDELAVSLMEATQTLSKQFGYPGDLKKNGSHKL